ncbi:aspartate/glutamate racemase family protein [Uliginosibacterium sp. H3]|uniref:Aspartate/glutamate racemase family protein n=1 Tax=Uliginosibacterium silvisoli TaxID=3114758 RepID=A0ABU6K2L2_9RHOO|nr:aspartate/glutamate racemase family protein [Uliginosibacterium sp. H3]
MRRLLIINPNTSTSVTRLLQTRVQALLGDEVRVCTATARFGAPYIACEASYAVAAHATLDAWASWLAQAAEEEAPDAVMLGCFGDPGLEALREGSPVPVSSLAEAAFEEATRHGRFAIVTGGERWKPMLQRLASGLGYTHLAGIQTVQPSGAQLAADPEWARRLLLDACRKAARDFSASAVILGGAGLAGVAATLQDELDFPLIDSVDAGVSHIVGLARRHAEQSAGRPLRKPGFDLPWSGVSPELARLGTGEQS